jgi:3-deoxy-manno-octulosonate cytidylyltransferase (CMP-KDO synthetase)
MARSRSAIRVKLVARLPAGAAALESASVMRAAIVIPARYGSSRFPGKPLAPIAGISLIRRVYERASRSTRAAVVYVATDDARIEQHVQQFGGKVVSPTGDYQSGTDRIAAALTMIEAREGTTFDQVVNVQGDEPLIDTESVDAIIDTLQRDDVDIVTLASPFETDDEWRSRDIVKVVTTLHGDALYFSRAAIPYGGRDEARRHAVLRAFSALAPSPLELNESLEQLRALQNGFRIRVLHTPKPHLGVDRPEDVARVERELAKLQS